MTRTYRQQVIDEYLNASGANVFHPAEFLAWLEPQREHRVWEIFFAKSDAEAAKEHRIALVRGFVAGLRIKVTITSATPEQSHIRLAVDRPTVISMPAFISPLDRRHNGGGYLAVAADDANVMRELYSQAASDLSRWIERYSGAAQLAGVDADAIAAAVGKLSAAAISPDDEAAA